jgi:IclR family transcriptional regulator, acetate operon repressor
MAVRALSSVLKSLDVLDAVAAASRPMSLSEIARVVGEARGATLQRLVTLAEGGLVEQTEAGGYRLTLRMVRYANAAMEQANLGARVADVLQDLVSDSNETASLAVLDGPEAVIVRRVESRGVLRADLRVGSHLNLELTAMGRILATYASPAQRERWREAGTALPDEAMMEKIRADGYAINGMTGPRSVSAVAAPVFDERGDCVATVALSGPTAGFEMDECGALVKAAAQQINARLKGDAQ